MATLANPNSRLGFTLSPLKVALSVLIQDLCTPDRVLTSTRPALAMFLLQQVRQADDCEEKSLRQLCEALAAFPATIGVSLDKQLVPTLRRIQSPDDLFDTLINLEALLQDGSAVDDDMPGLDSSSVLGIFVRKVLLAFHRSMFDGLSHLFTRMEKYIAAFDDENAGRSEPKIPQAHSELSNFIQHHADEIESMPSSLQMRSDLDAVLRSMGEPAGGSYLRFLYALQQRDYQAVLEHLHRYFDYAMVGRGAGGTGRERGVLQWAVLQLASVHFRLGHMPLALLALEEAVRLAQHASDHHCLAAALVWLVRLVGVAGERELESQLLRRALVRSAQLGLQSLHEQALLALALHKINHPPRRADDLNANIHQAPSAAASQVVWRALGGTGVAGAGGTHQGAGLVLETCMRSALGHSQLVSAHVFGGTGIKVPADLVARSVCLKASHEAEQHGPAGALKHLVQGRDAFPMHLMSLWHHACLLLLLQHALASKQFSAAQVIAVQMGGMLVPCAQAAPLLEAELARADVLMHTGDPVHALALLHRLKEVCADRRVGVEGVPVTVTLSAALASVGSCGTALGVALAALAQAEDAGMDSARIAGTLVLASLELQAGRAAHAQALLLRVLALALSSASVLLRAQAHLLLAKCVLGGAPSPYACSPLHAAAAHLDKAVALLLMLGAVDDLKEAAHLRALTAHAMSDDRKRDEAAAIYIKACTATPSGMGSLHQLCLAPSAALTAIAATL